MKQEVLDIYKTRRIDTQLLNWKEGLKANKTILLLSGARRTGKTTALEYLGTTHFDGYLKIEVDKLSNTLVKMFSDKEKCVGNFKDYLLTKGYDDSNITDGLLIFFDEIQAHNELKSSISILNEELPCAFACTGSALWIHDTAGERPTPDYEPLTVHPFTFREFLSAIGDGVDQYKDALNTFNERKNCSNDQCLERLFRLYLVVGGMPQPIVCYIRNKDKKDVFYLVHKVIGFSITNTYINDMEKYSKQFSLPITSAYSNVFESIGECQNIEDEARIYEKLEAMNIVVMPRELKEINAKLSSSFDRFSIKKFALDCGILFYHYSHSESKEVVDRIYRSFVNGKDHDNNGRFYENYVATALTNRGFDNFFKTFSALGENEKGIEEVKNYELDFITSTSMGVTVIEAKSGKDKTSSSLNVAMKKYPNIKQAYILSSTFCFDKTRMRKGPHKIPFYAIEFVLEDHHD